MIVVPPEGGPEVLMRYRDENSDARMLDWLTAHPRLLHIVGEALEPEREGVEAEAW